MRVVKEKEFSKEKEWKAKEVPKCWKANEKMIDEMVVNRDPTKKMKEQTGYQRNNQKQMGSKMVLEVTQNKMARMKIIKKEKKMKTKKKKKKKKKYSERDYL